MLNDLAAARAHIAALTGDPESRVTIQTFTDGERPNPDPLAHVMHGSAGDRWPRLVQLQERGAGVFVSVNATNFTGRTKRDIIAIRAVWAEDDKAGDAPRTDWPIAPHIIIESSRGKFHYYWRVSGITDAAAVEAINRGIAATYGTDKNAIEVNRVLRLAGTVHQKNPAAKFTVRIVHATDSAPYTADELAAAFPPLQETHSGGPRRETFELVHTLSSGSEGMHEAAVILAARFAASNVVDEESAKAFISAIVKSGAGAARFEKRHGEIAAAVASAYGKFTGFTDLDTGDALQPLDLFAESSGQVDFHAEDFPEVIGRLAADIAHRTGCDPLIPSMTALAACAALAPDRMRLQVKERDTTWRESARLWVALVGEPSSKKTPGISAVLGAVMALQERLAAEQRAALEAWRVEAARAKEAKLPAPTEPHSRRVLAGDSTTEALVNILEHNEHGLLVLHDELSGFFGSMDAYRQQGTSKDRPFYLQAYNGGFYTVDRVSKGERSVPNLSLCSVGGIQPDPMRQVAGKLNEDGLLQRFIALPVRDATAGADIPADHRTAAAFDRLVTVLFEAREGAATWPALYRLAPDAQTALDEARQRIYDIGRSPGIDRRLASALGKAEGQLARLVLTYHLIENRASECLFSGDSAPAETVDAVTARKAIRMYFRLVLPGMHSFYRDIIGRSPVHEHAHWIAGYILSRSLEQITERDVYRAYRELRGDEGRRGIQDAMRLLELASWVSPVADKRGGATEWRVNPAVHSKFAERAALEADRRERERAEISRNAAKGRQWSSSPVMA